MSDEKRATWVKHYLIAWMNRLWMGFEARTTGERGALTGLAGTVLQSEFGGIALGWS
jgi:hypothetical protein